MISKRIIEGAVLKTIKRSVCQISPDVRSSFETVLGSEQGDRSKWALLVPLRRIIPLRLIPRLNPGLLLHDFFKMGHGI